MVRSLKFVKKQVIKSKKTTKMLFLITMDKYYIRYFLFIEMNQVMRKTIFILYDYMNYTMNITI